MSYAVLHMEKYKAGAIRGIQNHNERLKESKTNPDIDYTRSNQNIDLLGEDNRSYYMRAKEKIADLNLPKAIRKDAVFTVGFIATSDKAFFDNLSPEQTKRFFQESHDFLKDRYGEKNIIASKVHMDEKTPHLHCHIVPITKDGRLSAKSIFTRVEMKLLQKDYHQHMNEKGFDLEKGMSDQKHVEISKLKKQTLTKELDELKEQVNKIEVIKEQIGQLEIEREAINQSLKPYLKVEHKIEDIKALETHIGKVDKLLNKVSISLDDFEKIQELAQSSFVLKEQLNGVQSQKKELKLKLNSKEKYTNELEEGAKRLVNNHQDLRDDYKKLLLKNKKLGKNLEVLEKHFGEDNVKKVLDQERENNLAAKSKMNDLKFEMGMER